MHAETNLVGSGLYLDTGTYTADAVKQSDGSWEIHGHGSTRLLDLMVESAELYRRGVAFLPRQALKKPGRAATLEIKRSGQCVLSDGTVLGCSSLLQRASA